ncbi:hypothetical protein KR009_003657 [Drosophila setifemur]|nr:hypothetical protein KR009_003657 [Drosophila setifemur]
MLRTARQLLALPLPFRLNTQAVNYYSKKGTPPERSLWSLLFDKYLLLTNTVGSGLFLVVGDAIAQEYDQLKEKQPFDLHRSGRLLITGLIIGPIQHGFYLRLDRLLTGTSRHGIWRKILVDQLVMSPTFIFLFFYITSLLEGRTIRESNAEISEKFLWTWLLDCCFWPGFQYVNFRWLKAAHRVVFINLTNCGYIVVLSKIKHGLGQSDN